MKLINVRVSKYTLLSIQNTRHYYQTKTGNLFIIFNELHDPMWSYQLLAMERKGGIQDAAKTEELRLLAVVTGLTTRIK